MVSRVMPAWATATNQTPGALLLMVEQTPGALLLMVEVSLQVVGRLSQTEESENLQELAWVGAFQEAPGKPWPLACLLLELVRLGRRQAKKKLSMPVSSARRFFRRSAFRKLAAPSCERSPKQHSDSPLTMEQLAH